MNAFTGLLNQALLVTNELQLVASDSGVNPKSTMLWAHDINSNGWIVAIAVRNCNSTTINDVVVLVPGIACEPDINGDDVVNTDDLLIVINGWGACGNPSLCPGDVTGNGTINVDDLLAVINGWGACPTFSCPEEESQQQSSGQSSAGELSAEDIIEAMESMEVDPAIIDAVRDLLGLN